MNLKPVYRSQQGTSHRPDSFRGSPCWADSFKGSPCTPHRFLILQTMNLDNLPPEILDLIAYYLLALEHPSDILTKRSLCNFTDAQDPHHRANSATTNPPFPAGSSEFALASTSRYLRNCLFLSRDSRVVCVQFTAKGRRLAEGISPALLASVE